MKKILIVLLISCSCTALAQKYRLTVTFDKGPHKGTHTFFIEKGNYASKLTLNYFEGVSTVSGTKLISENGLRLLHFSRTFIGEASVKDHQTKQFTSGCGSLNFLDTQQTEVYQRIDGDFTACSTTDITKIDAWKKRVYKSKRTVFGAFTEQLKMVVKKDDGSREIITTPVTVQFTVQESRRK